jgi:hypothetical protein
MLPVRTIPLVSRRRLAVRMPESRRCAEGLRRPRSRAGAAPRASREGERHVCTSLVPWLWRGLPSSASRVLVGRARLGHGPHALVDPAVRTMCGQAASRAAAGVSARWTLNYFSIF